MNSTIGKEGIGYKRGRHRNKKRIGSKGENRGKKKKMLKSISGYFKIK